MTTTVQALTVLALGAMLMAATAQTAQTIAAAPVQPPPALSSTEQTIQDIKNPFAWMSWGADLRLRNEYFNDAQTLTSNPQFNPKYAHLHSQDVFRYRGRVWTSITPVEDLSLNARLAAEPREWMEPSSSSTFRGPDNLGQSGFEGRYGIIDSLNVQWRKPLDLPATLTVGRQNIFLGDGWLVGDGTPGDGSWTAFLDAARLTYELLEQRTTIDAIGIVQYARPDAWLPTIGPSSSAGSPAAYSLTDQNEKGAILWIANKSLPAANLDGYFIYKHDTRINNPPPAGTSGDNADIYTVGGRVSGLLKDHWAYSAEGAYQLGHKQDPLLNQNGNNPLLAPSAQTTGFRDLKAFGVNSKLSYLFQDQLNNQVFAAFEFLSGDDPGTGTDEMFDVLWGRWPRWSALYNTYSYMPETRRGQTANLYRFGPGWSLSPLMDMDVSVSYNLLYSDQEVPTRANVTTAFSQSDSFRGHYLQAILRYKFSPHLSGLLLSEYSVPGHFYADTGQPMSFLRAELTFTF